MIVRPASLADLAKLTDVYNYYVEYSPATFDIQPFTPQQREGWFHDHSDGHRHRLLVAEQKPGEILGYAASGPFRSKEGYQTTVEVTVYCHPAATGKGVGAALYRELFELLKCEDVHRAVAGIAQPNAASNALHERFGFVMVGTFTDVGRKFGTYIDVLWMEKVMPPKPQVEISKEAS
ncbi:MAG: N-acetyltransferase [Acidobacteriaceae bacterium]|nr:N-acetyltransferase [Acidobacteriaceae bacterium]